MLSRAPQCRGCGTFTPARIREHAASDKPVAAAISLSEKPSSFGAISRLNQSSSRWPGCSRAQRRLRRCPSLIASPRARFTSALRRGSLPAAVCEPRRLLDPTLWPRLAFFALVDPNGAHLPARPTIPSPYVSRRRMIADEAARLYDEQLSAQAPYWNALDECGGKIVPDMVFDPKRKRWQRAGEFADVPARLMRANLRRPPTGRADGNLDRITDMVQGALGDPDLTTDDVLAFFCANDRPSMQGARKEAATDVPESDNDPASHGLVTLNAPTYTDSLWFDEPDLARRCVRGHGAPSGRPRVAPAP